MNRWALRRLTRRLCACVAVTGALALTAAALPAQALPGPGLPVPPAYSVTDRFAIGRVLAGQLGTVTASCNPGEERIGGGFSIQALGYQDGTLPVQIPGNRYPISMNAPTAEAGWTVQITNRGESNELLVAHATCASAPVGAVVVTGTSRATCPSSSIVTGGGWSYRPTRRASDDLALRGSQPAGQGWAVSALRQVGFTGSFETLRTSAVCITAGRSVGPGGTWTLTAPAGALDSITFADTTVNCPVGSIAAGAGFRFDDADGRWSLLRLAPPTTTDLNRWQMTAASLTTAGVEVLSNPGGSATFIPVCFRIPQIATASIGSVSAPRTASATKAL
jgi:hypothetical protein